MTCMLRSRISFGAHFAAQCEKIFNYRGRKCNANIEDRKAKTRGMHTHVEMEIIQHIIHTNNQCNHPTTKMRINIQYKIYAAEFIAEHLPSL